MLVCLCVPFFFASIFVSFLIGDHEPQREVPRKHQGLIATSHRVSDNVCVLVLLCVICMSADKHAIGKYMLESAITGYFVQLICVSVHFLPSIAVHFSAHLCVCVCVYNK